MAKVVSGVYRIRNVISGTYYIGSSDNIYRRFEAHRRALRTGKHKNIGLQTSWRRHGEDAFKFEVLGVYPSCTIREEERKLLREHFGNPKCCNMHDETYHFPRTGRTHSDETKAKISAKVQDALAEGRGGHFIPSEETRKKMSEALKGNQCAKGHKRTEAEKDAIAARMRGNQNWLGKTHTEESKAKMGRCVIATAPDGAQTTYPTITKLRAVLGLTPPTVDRALKSGVPLAKGRMKGWSFAYA